jgi:hypothetical protein
MIAALGLLMVATAFIGPVRHGRRADPIGVLLTDAAADGDGAARSPDGVERLACAAWRAHIRGGRLRST